MAYPHSGTSLHQCLVNSAQPSPSPPEGCSLAAAPRSQTLAPTNPAKYMKLLGAHCAVYHFKAIGYNFLTAFSSLNVGAKLDINFKTVLSIQYEKSLLIPSLRQKMLGLYKNI